MTNAARGIASSAMKGRDAPRRRDRRDGGCREPPAPLIPRLSATAAVRRRTVVFAHPDDRPWSSATVRRRRRPRWCSQRGSPPFESAHLHL